jgi:hypothetical protein
MYSSCARQRPSPDASAEEAMDERRFDRLATMLGTGSRRVALRLTAAPALAQVRHGRVLSGGNADLQHHP